MQEQYSFYTISKIAVLLIILNLPVVCIAQAPSVSFAFTDYSPKTVTIENGGVEYYQVKSIKSDGTVQRTSSTDPILLLIKADEVGYTWPGFLSKRFVYSHTENGNRVYFENVGGGMNNKGHVDRCTALIVSSDKSTVNLLYFSDAVTKKLSQGYVYKKLTNNNIGQMYE